MRVSGLGPARISRSNPLARGLVFALVHRNGVPFDAVTGQRALPSLVPGVPGVKVTANPPGARAAVLRNLGSLGYYQFPTYSLLLDRLVGRCSVFVEGTMPEGSTANAGRVFQSGESGNGFGVGIQFDYGSSQVAGFGILGDNGFVGPSIWNSCGASNAAARAGLQRVMATVDGTNARFYAQNKLWETVASAFTPSASTSRRTGVFTNWSLGSAEAEYSVGFAWDRVLTLSEYQQLYRDPWQLFAPSARRLYVESAAVPALTQSRYRWRNDDGSESAATWAAAENTAITLAQNTPRRLRVQVQSTNDKPSASYKLQYRKVGDPGWDDVT
jgi:hypothetical protein